MFAKLMISACAGTLLLAAGTAEAQYYDPYDRPPPPRYRYGPPPPPPPPYGYDYGRPPPPPPYGYRPGPPPPPYGYRRPARFGEGCVTSRGVCPVPPGPVGAPCRCYIDGFGTKRGIIQ